MSAIIKEDEYKQLVRKLTINSLIEYSDAFVDDYYENYLLDEIMAEKLQITDVSLYKYDISDVLNEMITLYEKEHNLR